MSEKQKRLDCACGFTELTRTLDTLGKMVRAHEPNWESISSEVKFVELHSELYEQCLGIEATKHVSTLRDAVTKKNRRETLNAIGGLEEVQSSICEAEAGY